MSHRGNGLSSYHTLGDKQLLQLPCLFTFPPTYSEAQDYVSPGSTAPLRRVQPPLGFNTGWMDLEGSIKGMGTISGGEKGWIEHQCRSKMSKVGCLCGSEHSFSSLQRGLLLCSALGGYWMKSCDNILCYTRSITSWVTTQLCIARCSISSPVWLRAMTMRLCALIWLKSCWFKEHLQGIFTAPVSQCWVQLKLHPVFNRPLYVVRGLPKLTLEQFAWSAVMGWERYFEDKKWYWVILLQIKLVF